MKKLIFSFLFTVFVTVQGYGEEPVKAPEVKEEQVETSHEMKINGEVLRYKAVAGTMLLKDDKQKPKAAIFYTAYIKEGGDDLSSRPITFCFNGGPGSASLWLHLGVFGPRRIELTENGQALVPGRVVDNQSTLLQATDLVFIDPVSTGYSRAVSKEDSKKFHGVEEDIKSVAEFIRLYTTRNQRWGSPKFLAGESYGTMRAAGVAGHLQHEHRMYLNGVILVSSILDYQTIQACKGGNDLPYALFLPTYSSVAWYHKKLPADLQVKPLKDILVEVQGFTEDQYNLALFKGDQLAEEERRRVVEKLVRYTGLDAEYWERANLRVDVLGFCKELLRQDQRTIGRFDGRQKGIDADFNGQYQEHDASMDTIIGGFAAVYNQYVSGELKWESDDSYKVLTRDVWPWDFGGTKNSFVNLSLSLKDAMMRNPQLKVFVASGYYDLATPYFATDYTFNHLNLDPSFAEHVTKRYYEGGHMMYTDLSILQRMNEDLLRFIRDSVGKKSS